MLVTAHKEGYRKGCKSRGQCERRDSAIKGWISLQGGTKSFV